MNDPDMGTWYYQYDASGALTRQTDAKGQVLLMSYDPLDRLTSKGKLSFEDLFDTKSTTDWIWNAAQTVPYNDGGNNVVMNTGDFVNWRGFNRIGYALAGGKALQLRFKVNNVNVEGSADAHFMIENNDTTYRRFGAYVWNGALNSVYNNGSGNLYGNTLISSLQANVWYVLRITLDDVNGFVVEAYEENNPANRGAFTYSMTAGKSWRFSSTIKNYISYVDDYREMDVLARYSYDEYNPTNAQWGKGRRTGMIDGSGKTYWRYDQRGRLRWEDKWIGAADHFATEWSYNSADLLAWMKYPGGSGGQPGEQVTYSYHPQMALNGVTGSSTYAQSTRYDAAGRMTQIVRGPGSLTSSYSYYQWDETARPEPDENLVWQGGRLKRMTTGTLQDLQYYYDASGNVRRIVDAYAPTQQTQSFDYDQLDRLTSAFTSGTGMDGSYSESYNYDASTGNISQKAGGTYTYDAIKKHAVRRVSGSGGATKTIQIRAYSTPCNDGVRATMQLRVNGNVVATWNDVAASWTTHSFATPLSGKDQIEVVYPNDCNINGFDRNLYIDYVIVDGQTVQAEGAATLIDWGAGDASSDGQNMALGSQNLTGNGALRFVKGAGAYAAGYDANGNMTSRIVNGAAYLYVYDAENRLTGVSGAGAATFVYDADGNRVKGTVAGVTTVYIGSHFEWSNGVAKKYYYAGSLRIAMNQGGTLSWLLGDHLGSTTLTVNAAGARQGELLFKPFGETRFTYGTTPTSYRFTGQREENALGIYFYNARWYDHYLNRWTSPDPIIPDPTNPLDWDRYGYCRNNPLKYVDDSGNIPIIPLIIGIVIIGSKLIDYGWTASDMYQSGQVLADPNASGDDKLFAGINIGLAALFEGGEPDDFLPAGIPLDDIGRRALIKGMREAYQAGGREALEKYLRDNLGNYADDVLEHIGFLNPVDPNKLHHIFDNPKHHLDVLLKNFGSQSSAFRAVERAFNDVAGKYTTDQLKRGIQIVVDGIKVTVQGTIVNGKPRVADFWIP